MVSPRGTSVQLTPIDDVSASVTEPAEDVSLPARNPVLALQHMEAALVRADLGLLPSAVGSQASVAATGHPGGPDPDGAQCAVCGPGDRAVQSDRCR